MKLNVRMNDVPDLIGRTPDGDYQFSINSVDYRPNKRNEGMVVVEAIITACVDDSDQALGSAVIGRKMNIFYTIESKDDNGKINPEFTEKRLSRLKKFMVDAGIEWEDDNIELNDFPGSEFVGRVGPQKNNPQYAEIKSTYPLD